MRSRSLVVCTILALCGCSLHQGYPGRYTNKSASAELATLTPEFEQKKVDLCESGKNDKGDTLTEKEKQTCRNGIVTSMVRAVDVQFDVFRRDIFASGALLNVSGDLAAIALSTAGALVGATATKTILSAVSAGVTGSKSAIDKDLLFQKSTQVLITRMEALRSEKLVDILAQLNKPTDQYPLAAALIDVETYYQKGSIVAAITSIDGDSGDKSKKASDERHKLAVHNTILAQ